MSTIYTIDRMKILLEFLEYFIYGDLGCASYFFVLYN